MAFDCINQYLHIIRIRSINFYFFCRQQHVIIELSAATDYYPGVMPSAQLRSTADLLSYAGWRDEGGFISQ